MCASSAASRSTRNFERLTGERGVSDIALWLTPGTPDGEVQRAARELAQQQLGIGGELIEFVSVAQLRATSLRIFDRSFAVTYWLQAVAIGIGLFGIAASFSAHVLAVVAGEGAAWTAIGALAGLALGLAVSVVLVHVVNPQSFHWTMGICWCRGGGWWGCARRWWRPGPSPRGWRGGRRLGGMPVLAVKEDW